MGRFPVVPVDPRTYVPQPRHDDPRLGEVVRALTDVAQCQAGDVVLIGVPEDRGVAINRGRAGAAAGPAAFRAAFYRLTPGAHGELQHADLWDAGDVTVGDRNAQTHEHLAAVVTAVAAHGALPLVIGGSHDNTYGGIRGVVQQGGACGVINCDAHLDVRPAEADGGVGSGTPFRRLIDDGVIPGNQLVEFGYQPQVSSAAHVAYAREHGVRLWSLPDLRAGDPRTIFAQLCADLARQHGRVAISFDLDGIVAAAAPGVSAPAVRGFSAEEAVAFMQLAGQCRELCYVDLMELNPSHDVNHMTARLVALLVWNLLSSRWQTRTIYAQGSAKNRVIR